MKNISILVLLYNREMKNSETLNSLLQINNNYSGCKLVIWNNGPESLCETDLSVYTQLGFECELVETLENKPLSHIYNEFLKQNCAKKNIILDQDSSLTNKYWQSIITTNNLLLLPKIYSHGKLSSPSKLPKRNNKYRPSQRFSAITSGIVLSNTLLDLVEKKYNTVFDNNYAFYGIDTSFMLRIKKLAICDHISVIEGFEHSLSKHENESREITLFRAREMAISTALTTRHYPSYSAYRRFIKSVIKSLKKQNNYPVNEMFKALFSGKHPKCKG